MGLAIAAEVSRPDRRVVIFERHRRFGQEISSRNSEVVHAGLYDPPGSLKARLCVAGRHALYEFADKHGVACKKVGKLVVAVRDDEIGSLEVLAERGETNGVEGLRVIDARDVRRREPAVSAVAALSSPETGVVDSHGLMSALLAQARDRGADVAFGVKIVGLAPGGGAWRLAYTDDAGGGDVLTRSVVNAAGMEAQDIMRRAGLDPMRAGLALHRCKGEYFSLVGRHRRAVGCLVYPAPVVDAAGLGIHTVVDMAGGLRLGPSAFYVADLDYTVDPANAVAFADAVRPFLPFVAAEDLTPSMAGIRPKLSGPGEPSRDFHIAHEVDLGLAGLFDLAGIESPGLTACLAIGRHVGAMVTEYLAAP